MADSPATKSSVPENKLRLLLVSAEAELLDTLCDEVTLPGREGELGVLPGHAPFLGTLEPGVLAYRKGSTTERVALGGGFAEVMDGTVRVLVDSAELPDQVDRGAVAAALGDARKNAEDPMAEDLVAAQDRVKALEAQLAIVN